MYDFHKSFPTHDRKRRVRRHSARIMALRAAAASDGSPIASAARRFRAMSIVTYSTSNYLHWLQHLHANIQALQLRAATLVACSADDVSLGFARSRGLRTIDVRNTSGCAQCSLVGISQGGEAKAQTFRKGSYTRIVHAKSVCVSLHLARCERCAEEVMLFVDGDVTLFADPRPYFPPSAEIAFLIDIGPGLVGEGMGAVHGCGGVTNWSHARAHLNTGFFLMRRTRATRRLWRRMLLYHKANPAVMQQPALYTLLTGRSKYSGNLRVAVHSLDTKRFLSGFCFYQGRPLRHHGILPDEVRVCASQTHAHSAPLTFGNDQVTAIHHNWIRGDTAKFLRAVAYDAAIDGSASQRGGEHFVARARAAMDSRPSWQPPLELIVKSDPGRVSPVPRP